MYLQGIGKIPFSLASKIIDPAVAGILQHLRKDDVHFQFSFPFATASEKSALPINVVSMK
jgi:hypothetical protein